MSGPADPAACPGCGAPIWIGETEDGIRVPLEAQADLGPDAARYTVIRERAGDEPHIIGTVSPTAEVRAYSDHRVDCPDYGNSLG